MPDEHQSCLGKVEIGLLTPKKTANRFENFNDADGAQKNVGFIPHETTAVAADRDAQLTGNLADPMN